MTNHTKTGGASMTSILAREGHVPMPRMRDNTEVGRLTLTDLSDSTCRWPCGKGPPFMFCGEPPTPGSPYCPHHTRKAYVR